MHTKFKSILLAAIVGCTVCSASAQYGSRSTSYQQARTQRVARNNHLYFHVNVASGNIYTAAVPSVISWGLNMLTRSNFFENSVDYAVYSGEMAGRDLKFRYYHYDGFEAKDFFNNFAPSIKIGYQSNRMGEFNFGLYGVAEYRINQVQSAFDALGEPYTRNCFHRALFGGSVFGVFGGSSRSIHLVVEGGLRYSVPVKYNGVLGTDKDVMDKGLTSHWAVKAIGRGALQDFGIYADFNHFNMVKIPGAKFHMWNVGISWTVTPGQVK